MATSIIRSLQVVSETNGSLNFRSDSRSESKSDSRQKIRFQIAANQILSVSIHHMLYPITEEVLHQVFDPYGYVEKIVIASTKSNEFQALIQFESSMCAAQARTFLQGKYIYDGVCQMDIQYFRWDENPEFKSNTNVVDAATAEPKNPCNFRSDSFGTSAEKVESSITTADLNFIRNEILGIIVMTDRIQDRLEAMNSTVQNFTHTMSKSSQASSSIPVSSPTKSKVCNDSGLVVSTTPEIHMENYLVIFENENKLSTDQEFPEQALEELDYKTCFKSLLLYGDNIHYYTSKVMLKMIDLESALSLFDGYVNKRCGNKKLAVAYNLFEEMFDLMLEPNDRKIFEKIVFIFDPGGGINLASDYYNTFNMIGVEKHMLKDIYAMWSWILIGMQALKFDKCPGSLHSTNHALHLRTIEIHDSLILVYLSGNEVNEVVMVGLRFLWCIFMTKLVFCSRTIRGRLNLKLLLVFYDLKHVGCEKLRAEGSKLLTSTLWNLFHIYQE